MEEMNLEEMRSQFAILKEQLDKQEIVNDRLLRETMKGKTRIINDEKRLSYIACVLALILIMPIGYFFLHLRLPFCIVSCLLFIYGIVSNYYGHRQIDNLNFMTDDLATIAHVMKDLKKQYYRSLYFYSPAILILWSIWFYYEISLVESVLFALLLMLNWIITCVIFGKKDYNYYRKILNTIQDIIDDIEKN